MSESRPVVGIVGYTVSNNGRVFDLVTNREIVGWVHRRYRRVELRNGDARISRSVHSLVLEAFVGPRPIGKHAAHLDGDPMNNAVSNLAWATRRENESHKIVHGTRARGERHGAARLTQEQVAAIRASNLSRRVLAKRYGVGWSTIQMIVSGHTWRQIDPTEAATAERNIRELATR